ncbi:hypothetical protein GGS21DRAFT_487871 [Xylaria nigripes]|nr:hypothetical protein GGS21DRAFT_487871 [Xylaria nigripes]
MQRENGSPSTPRPHRFLVPKRSQPGDETPKPAFQPSSQQFQATPRFSLQSTSRTAPSSSLTPFRPGLDRDVDIDSSPPSVRYVEDVQDDNHDRDIMLDGEYEDHRFSYDETSSVHGHDMVMVYESSPVCEAEGDRGERDESGERWAKRRRVSASPRYLGADRSSPIVGDQYEPDLEMREVAFEINSSLPAPSVASDDVDSHAEIPAEYTEIIGGSQSHIQEEQPHKPDQPTFQKAPRFKPTDDPEDVSYPEPLPDIFSPRRKGPKYVAGGLAAEVRNWLVDVEAGIGSGSMLSSTVNHDKEWAARIQVDELRGGDGNARGMTLILGRAVIHEESIAANELHSQETSENERGTDVLDMSTVKLILAGSGRLSGLGIASDVRPGSLLGISRPTWDVALDGLGRWVVACDWTVLR